MTAHHLYLLAPGASLGDVRRFYIEALGLTEMPKPPSLADTPVLWFRAGPIALHIGHPPLGDVGGGHTALATGNVEAARVRLLALGYSVDDNVIPMGYPRFYVSDPWGNQFEILPSDLP